MPLLDTATEHPLAVEDGLSITNRSPQHVYVMGDFCGVLDLLFNGPGNPAYKGATLRIEDAFYEYSAAGGSLRVFRRRFWGPFDAGIVAVVYLKVDRPILMSVVGINLPDEIISSEEAEKIALHNASIRSKDL